MQVKIIQTSEPRTASTVLHNILFGMISPNEPAEDATENVDKPIVITHKTNIDEWISTYGKKYDLYFICSERDKVSKYQEYKMDKKYHSYKNVLIFQFEELDDTDQSEEQIVDIVHKKVRKLLPNTIELNKETGLKRLKDMNMKYSKIKDMPFRSYVDPFYSLHGHHRNREDS
jgi:hypothetical protein|tara:strand:+ start:2235 stop:2753 length:519 start_codon:yes stop_codon:yes gene_type:complete